MIDIDNIDIANHEFTGEELGELLLASVKQMKNGESEKDLNNLNDLSDYRRTLHRS